MTVAELLDRMTLSDGNKVILRDLEDGAGCKETELELTLRGWTWFPTGYQTFAQRVVFGVSLHGKKIVISMA